MFFQDYLENLTHLDLPHYSLCASRSSTTI